MKTMKKWLADFKANGKQRRKEELQYQFQVIDRDGFLWLTHNGVAFMKVSMLSNAAKISEMLDEARKAAVEYEKI